MHARISLPVGASIWLLVWVLMTATMAAPVRGQVPVSEDIRVARLIEAQIRGREADDRFTCQGELVCGIALIPDFYAARDFAPVWSSPREPAPQALALLAEIRRVDQDGLDPGDYHFLRLQSLAGLLWGAGSDATPETARLRADIDLLMTDAAFMLGAHIVGGRVNPETIHPAWSAFSHEVDLVRLLNESLKSPVPEPLFQELYPAYTGYTGLRRALADYRRIAAAGGWPTLEEGAPLQRGDENLAVGHLRERLRLSGDLADTPELQPHYFDETLESAVKGFQRRHGLMADGVVGRKTREVMNVPVERRIEQLLINMERWRWIPADLGPRYLAVNIADFRLTMVDEGRVRDTMRVVVGRTYRKTPVFSGTMTYLEFNPFWNIPRRLAIEDILPRIRRDPAYIERQGIRVFSGWGEDAVALAPEAVDWASLGKDHFPIRLQQAPGPLNALGRIKFMFPNRHAVYLHDTPSRGQFDAVSRSFSSGCIRVEDPAALAAFVLEGTEGWDRERVENFLDSGSGERRVVNLQQPIPVHLLYWTAWADDENRVHFREDIYERDPPLMRALKAKPTLEARPSTDPLPGSYPTDVDVDEVGFRIVADPAAS